MKLYFYFTVISFEIVPIEVLSICSAKSIVYVPTPLNVAVLDEIVHLLLLGFIATHVADIEAFLIVAPSISITFI